MTTKRKPVFGFLLKTVLIVAGLALTALLVLNLWSRWELQRAQSAFETAVTPKANFSATTSRDRLRTAAKAALKLDFEAEEKKRIGNLATLPLEDWTAQDENLVAVVAARNRSVLDSVILALVSDSPEDSQPPGEFQSDDRLDKSPIEIHLQSILAARVLAAEARFAIRTGDLEFATKRLASLKHLAEGFESQGIFLDVLMGSSIERILDACLLDVINFGGATTSMNREDLAALVPEVHLMEVLRFALNTEATQWVQAAGEAKHDEGLPSVVIAPIVGPVFKCLLQVAYMDTGTRLLGLVDTPFGTDTGAFTSPPEPPRWNIIRRLAGMPLPNMLNMIGRSQVTVAQRQLLDAALAMSTTPWPGDAYPETRPDIEALTKPDPFSGQLLEYQLLDDGRLHLAVANGPELLDALKMSVRHNWLDPIVLGAPVTE